MKISEVKASKKAYMNLLLLADEQEDMIGRYLKSTVVNLRGWINLPVSMAH